MMISGSSPAGLAAGWAIGATAVQYPEPAGRMGEGQRPDGVETAIRVGIIARDTAEAAWEVAHRRFPEDRRGQVAHQLAMRVSDSHRHRRLSELDERPASEESPYWLGPFQNCRTFCPYLVGSYRRVAEELAGYIRRGFRTFVLDIPPSRRSWSTSAWCSGRRSRPHGHERPPAGRRHPAGRAPSRRPGRAVGRRPAHLRALERASNRLAWLLKDAGCRQGDRICLFLRKSPSAVASMLGVLKVGCVHVPIDLASPAARVEKIFLAADPRLVLADRTASSCSASCSPARRSPPCRSAGWRRERTPGPGYGPRSPRRTGPDTPRHPPTPQRRRRTGAHPVHLRVHRDPQGAW